MSDVGTAIDEARTELASAADEFMFDLCDILNPQFTDGGSSGDSLGLVPGQTNVPCDYKPARPGAQVEIGGTVYVGSHVLRLPWASYTVAITPEHRIKVHARDSMPEMVFEEPALIPGSYSVFVYVLAKFVQQGYIQ